MHTDIAYTSSLARYALSNLPGSEVAKPPEREIIDLIERLLMGLTLVVLFLVLVDSRLRFDKLGVGEQAEAPKVVAAPQNGAGVSEASLAATDLPTILTVSPPRGALERCIDGVQLRPLDNGWEQIGTCR